MADVIDVAKYIIHTANNNGDLITNLKLQKLLYYAQAWFLVNFNGKKLYNDPIEAWPLGPVIKKVYDEYKKFVKNPIEIEDDCQFPTLSDDEKEYLDDFCEKFMRYSATELVGMTHNEEPWINAYKNQKEISTCEMYTFYRNLVTL